jgi:hypothetical protein
VAVVGWLVEWALLMVESQLEAGLMIDLLVQGV